MARILSAWKGIQISSEIALDPEASEMGVFRKFVAHFMSLQKRLSTDYHSDNYFSDRLLTSVNILAIETTLRDPMSRKSQPEVKIIANHLTEKPRSEGTTSVFLTPTGETEQTAMYSLGAKYRGDAEKW